MGNIQIHREKERESEKWKRWKIDTTKEKRKLDDSYFELLTDKTSVEKYEAKKNSDVSTANNINILPTT